MFASQPIALHRLRLWPVHRVKARSFSFSRLPFSQRSCPSHSNWLSSEMQFWCPHVLRGCQISSLLGYFPHPCFPVTLQTHLDPAVDGEGNGLQNPGPTSVNPLLRDIGPSNPGWLSGFSILQTFLKLICAF